MLQTGFESKCDWLNDLVLNGMKELSIKNYSMHLHSECLHNVWSPIYHFNGPRSFNFIFNRENLPFSPKISAELRSKLCSCNNKASRRQRDWFTFWWAFVSNIHGATAISTQMVAVLKSELLSRSSSSAL